MKYFRYILLISLLPFSLNFPLNQFTKENCPVLSQWNSDSLNKLCTPTTDEWMCALLEHYLPSLCLSEATLERSTPKTDCDRFYQKRQQLKVEWGTIGGFPQAENSLLSQKCESVCNMHEKNALCNLLANIVRLGIEPSDETYLGDASKAQDEAKSPQDPSKAAAGVAQKEGEAAEEPEARSGQDKKEEKEDAVVKPVEPKTVTKVTAEELPKEKEGGVPAADDGPPLKRPEEEDTIIKDPLESEAEKGGDQPKAPAGQTEEHGDGDGQVDQEPGGQRQQNQKPVQETDMTQQQNQEAGQGAGELEQQNEEAGQGAGDLEQQNQEAGQGAGELEKQNQEAGQGAGELEQQNQEAGQGAGELEQQNQEAGEGAGELEQQNQEAGQGAGELEQQNQEAGHAPDEIEKQNQQVGDRPDTLRQQKEEIDKGPPIQEPSNHDVSERQDSAQQQSQIDAKAQEESRETNVEPEGVQEQSQAAQGEPASETNKGEPEAQPEDQLEHIEKQDPETPGLQGPPVTDKEITPPKEDVSIQNEDTETSGKEKESNADEEPKQVLQEPQVNDAPKAVSQSNAGSSKVSSPEVMKKPPVLSSTASSIYFNPEIQEPFPNGARPPPEEIYDDHDFKVDGIPDNAAEEDEQLISPLKTQEHVPYFPKKDGFEPNPSESHFLFYFFTVAVVCVFGYLVFHNKKKIIALVIEGRSNGNGRRRRPSTHGYKRLDDGSRAF